MKFFSKFNFHIIYKSKRLNIKFNNFIKKTKDFFTNKFNEKLQFQYQIVLKKRNLKNEIYKTIELIFLLFDNLNQNFI